MATSPWWQTRWVGTTDNTYTYTGDGGLTWVDAEPGELVPFSTPNADAILARQQAYNEMLSKKIQELWEHAEEEELKMQIFEYILVSKDDDGEYVAVEDHGFVVANSREAAAYQVGQLAAKKNSELELEPLVRPFRS